MGLSILAALAVFVATATAAHAGCATSTCPTGEPMTTTQQTTEVTLEGRIENALKDLEIFKMPALTRPIMCKPPSLRWSAQLRMQ
jgi:hypothetical protein